MAKRRGLLGPNGKASARASGGASQSETRLTDLARSFGKFRRENPPGTRIPDALRAGALMALEGGVAASELRQRCGITGGQLQSWRRTGPRGVGARDPQRVAQARVLSVVDDALPRSASKTEQTEQGGTVPLSLTVGGWSIRIAPSEG